MVSKAILQIVVGCIHFISEGARSAATERQTDCISSDYEWFVHLAGWPIDKDASEERVVERFMRLHVALFVRWIDEALKAVA